MQLISLATLLDKLLLDNSLLGLAVLEKTRSHHLRHFGFQNEFSSIDSFVLLYVLISSDDYCKLCTYYTNGV